MRKVLGLNQATTKNVKHEPQMNRKAMCFGMVGQPPLEIVAWLRDVFGLEQQVVTSTLTTNYLFSSGTIRARDFVGGQSCWQSLEQFLP